MQLVDLIWLENVYERRELYGEKIYKLIGKDGKVYDSLTPGTFGGHKQLKIYGRLDCPSALRYISKGAYVKYRVFFENEETAIAAGYRPCSICMPKEYNAWKKEERFKDDQEY